jgi:hypothetical protein
MAHSLAGWVVQEALARHSAQHLATRTAGVVFLGIPYATNAVDWAALKSSIYKTFRDSPGGGSRHFWRRSKISEPPNEDADTSNAEFLDHVNRNFRLLLQYRQERVERGLGTSLSIVYISGVCCPSDSNIVCYLSPLMTFHK